MQEKNELREEKASLKSDIENLNVQYQQRLRVMFPWGHVDPSVVVSPSYSYTTVPIPVPPGPIPVHPSLQPFPFFGNQNPGAIPGPCSTFIPYPTPADRKDLELLIKNNWQAKVVDPIAATGDKASDHYAGVKDWIFDR